MGHLQTGLVDLGVCDKGRSRIERFHKLRPEKPQRLSDGRGFDSPHLHQPLSPVEDAPRNHALPGSEGLLLSRYGLLERREDLLHLCDLGGLVADDLLGERDGVSVLPG